MCGGIHGPTCPCSSGCAESILMSFLEVSSGCKISQLHCNESAQTCVGFKVRYMARRVQQRMAGAPSPLIEIFAG